MGRYFDDVSDHWDAFIEYEADIDFNGPYDDDDDDTEEEE